MELLRALGAVAESAGSVNGRLAGILGLGPGLDPADHTEIFVFKLPPYASVYLGAEGMMGGEARDRIAGFWRAAGAAPPPEPDHLAALLSAYASLVESEDGAAAADRPAWRRMRHAFFWEHLASWLFPYLRRVDEVAPDPYRRWGRVLQDTLRHEALALGGPTGLPSHLREASPAAHEDEGPALLDAVLAPARSGVVLTRRDLARAAEEAGLGLRVGERRYILQNFFDQAPEVIAEWLAGEARRQAARLAEAPPVPTITDHWVDRARSTARRLAVDETPTRTLQEATNV